MGEDSSYRHHDQNGSILIVRLQPATTWYYIHIKTFNFSHHGLFSKKDSVTIIYNRFFETSDWGWVGLNVNRIGQKKVIDVMADTCTNTIWWHLNVY